MSLAENYCFDKSASIALVRTNVERAKPKPLLQAERANTQGAKPYVSALFLLVKFLLSQK